MCSTISGTSLIIFLQSKDSVDNQVSKSPFLNSPALSGCLQFVGGE